MPVQPTSVYNYADGGVDTCGKECSRGSEWGDGQVGYSHSGDVHGIDSARRFRWAVIDVPIDASYFLRGVGRKKMSGLTCCSIRGILFSHIHDYMVPSSCISNPLKYSKVSNLFGHALWLVRECDSNASWEMWPKYGTCRHPLNSNWQMMRLDESQRRLVSAVLSPDCGTAEPLNLVFIRSPTAVLQL